MTVHYPVKFNFGIVGCGAIGKRHAQLICKSNNLVALCDNVPSKAKQFAEEFGGETFASIDDLIARQVNIDVLVVCTPNGLHAEQSIKGLENGMHVLCEKPMALNVEDCKEMIAAAEKNNRHLMVVKQNRYNPPVLAVKELISEGKLGKVSGFLVNGFWNRPSSYYTDSWHGSLVMDGGTLFTQFSHFIDLLYWFLGDVESIEAMAGNFQHAGLMEFEDSASVLIKMKNGAIGSFNYNVNAFQKNMEGSVTLFGEKGTVKIAGEYLNKLEYWNVDGIEMPELKTGNPANDYTAHKGSMSNHSEVYDHLQHVLNGNSTPQPNAFEAMKTVEIISKIYQKIR